MKNKVAPFPYWRSGDRRYEATFDDLWAYAKQWAKENGLLQSNGTVPSVGPA
jgi:hypothetical protein